MEILYYFPNKDEASKTVGEFGIRIPEWDLSFYKMKLIRTLKGHLFVSGPSFKHTDPSGTEEYRSYWEFSKVRKTKFNDSALAALKEYYEKKYGKKLDDKAEQGELFV